MEVTYLSENCIKIRSKLANFVINPTEAIPKIEADAAISFLGDNIDVSRISQFSAVISGPGEYEIKGVKISSTKYPQGLVYKLSIDKMDVTVAKASALFNADNVVGAHVLIIEADRLPSDKTITAIQPNVVVLYGDKAKEAAKILKEGAGESISKFAVTLEKLPQEMEVITLG